MSNSEVLMNIGGSPGPGSPYPASSLLLSMLLAWLCCCEWLQHGQALAVLPTIWVITAVRLRGPSIRGGIFTFTNFCSEFVWKFYLDSFDWKSMSILSLYSELSLPLWSRSGDWESEWGLRRHGGWSLPGPELGLSGVLPPPQPPTSLTHRHPLPSIIESIHRKIFMRMYQAFNYITMFILNSYCKYSTLSK